MSSIRPAVEDLVAREPVWAALSDMFLDTDTSLSRQWRAEQLAASPYSIEQLEFILVNEVYPACKYNLLSVAGEWEGFNPEWLREEILRRLRSPLRALHVLNLGRLTVHASGEWRATKKAILAARERSAQSAAYLTLRSSGRAPAWHLARAAVVHIIRCAGQAPCLRAPLSSNVRPHMKFRVEYIATKQRPVYLFARQLEPGEFRVSALSRLGGVAIKPHVSSPRALSPSGEPDRTVFAFWLATANDLPKLAVGQVVELSNDSQTPS